MVRAVYAKILETDHHVADNLSGAMIGDRSAAVFRKDIVGSRKRWHIRPKKSGFVAEPAYFLGVGFCADIHLIVFYKKQKIVFISSLFSFQKYILSDERVFNKTEALGLAGFFRVASAVL